jgi:hypothetical protein
MLPLQYHQLTFCAQGEEVRKRIRAVAYVETSAKTGEGAFQALSVILSETVRHQTDQAKKKRD